MRSGYREIANRRRTIPAEVALAMLDKNVELLKVETEVSPEFVLKSELDALKERHTIHSQEVLSPAGQFAQFTGQRGPRAKGSPSIWRPIAPRWPRRYRSRPTRSKTIPR